MKKHNLLFLITIIICTQKPTILNAQNRRYDNYDLNSLSYILPKLDPKLQISEYIRRIFQDKKGNLWFGTNGDGVCRYDGKTLTYFSTKEGFAGYAVRGIVEDKDGNVWFGTDGGVSKYDGKSFTNFSTKEGLSSTDVWSMYCDKSGTIWVGTSDGLCFHKPSITLKTGEKAFAIFPILFADVKNPVSRFTPKLVWAVLEDKAGNLWFGTDGLGVCRYDGKSFTIFTEADGLANNNVGCILEDKKGNIWFGTRFGGVSRYDGKTFTNFATQDGLGSNFVYTILEDKTGKIWFSTLTGGVSRYDPSAALKAGKITFTVFKNNSNLTKSNHIQSMLEDKNGKLWFGFSGGLFRFDGQSFVNITKSGPWK
jgi:ligand-binding sensor domain-containing protein